MRSKVKNMCGGQGGSNNSKNYGWMFPKLPFVHGPLRCQSDIIFEQNYKHYPMRNYLIRNAVCFAHLKTKSHRQIKILPAFLYPLLTTVTSSEINLTLKVRLFSFEMIFCVNMRLISFAANEFTS